jgi:hypothetical protein
MTATVVGHSPNGNFRKKGTTMQRRVLQLFVVGFMALLGGCSFATQFQAIAQQPKDPAHALVGAWEGRWNNETFHRSGPAKAVITLQPETASTRLWLQVWQHRDLLSAEEYQTTKVKIEPAEAGGVKFHTKLAVRTLLMMTVDGQTKDDSITIRYSVVDVTDPEVEHEQGTMELHRVTRPPTK